MDDPTGAAAPSPLSPETDSHEAHATPRYVCGVALLFRPDAQVIVEPLPADERIGRQATPFDAMVMLRTGLAQMEADDLAARVAEQVLETLSTQAGGLVDSAGRRVKR